MADYPETDQIDPKQALFLLKNHCAILIVEGLPIGSEFGIDLVAYNIGEKFKGVKLIPPGVHFLYASSIDKNNSHHGPRTGLFHNFKTREILIKRWSTIKEDFDDEYQPTEIEVDRYRSNLEDLDRYLGAYSFSTYRTYLNLTNMMTDDVVNNLKPDCHRIRSVPYLTRDAHTIDVFARRRIPRATLCTNPTEESLLPDLKPNQSTMIHFTLIPDNHLESEQDISKDMITKYNLDTTIKLKHAFGDHDEGRRRLLAELQFSFITFLLCHVYQCFEQWKKILQLVCMADTGLEKDQSFYSDFAKLLRYQFDQIPEDLFDDIVESNNLVRHLLKTFFQNLDGCQTCTYDLKRSADELKKAVQMKFGWQFDFVPEDEQPVIVDL